MAIPRALRSLSYRYVGIKTLERRFTQKKRIKPINKA